MACLNIDFIMTSFYLPPNRETEDETETNEALRRRIKFQFFLPSPGIAKPVVSDGDEPIDEVLVTTKPITMERPANATYNITDSW